MKGAKLLHKQKSLHNSHLIAFCFFIEIPDLCHFFVKVESSSQAEQAGSGNKELFLKKDVTFYGEQHIG